MQIVFRVTRQSTKEESSRWKEFKSTIAVIWPHVMYVVIWTAALLFFIVRYAHAYSRPDFQLSKRQSHSMAVQPLSRLTCATSCVTPMIP